MVLEPKTGCFLRFWIQKCKPTFGCFVGMKSFYLYFVDGVFTWDAVAS